MWTTAVTVFGALSSDMGQRRRNGAKVLRGETFRRLTQGQDRQKEKRHELDDANRITDDRCLFQADEVFGKDKAIRSIPRCLLLNTVHYSLPRC
jgi:hypothetical protein